MFKNIRTFVGPSILSADFGILGEECQNIIKDGADSLHIDIMDGHFVPNLTIGPPVVASLRKRLPQANFDCHLMVTHPQHYFDALAKSKVNCITIHYEAQSKHPFSQLCGKIRSHGSEVGVSIKPKTQINQQIEKLINAGIIDRILVMTVEPGFGGQKFMEDMMPKVKYLRDKYPCLNIQVDGGITQENIQIVAKNGANCIVSGTGIFASKNKPQTISNMKQILNKYFSLL